MHRRDSTENNAASGHNLALSWLEALDDECQDMANHRIEHSAHRQEYIKQRVRCAAETDCDPESDGALQSARTAFRKEVIEKMHKAKRSALCFSGGGIRSATFGLGVMQGLAAHSETSGESDRPKLLGEFDYLSTVSGGGYLGGWFSSWAARSDGEDEKGNAIDGPAQAIRGLASVPETDFDPEPKEVRHLRKFSNYLMPKLGLLSGDTLAALASVFRNMFLNWLILLPLLSAILLVPELSRQAMYAWEVPRPTEWFLLITGLLSAMLATGYVGYDLPSAGNSRKSYAWYLWCCLFPLTLAAVHLSLFWVWLEPGYHTDDPVWTSILNWNLPVLGRKGITWLHFGLFGLVMHGGGMLIGVLAAKRFLKHPPTKVALAATLVAAVTGFVGALLGWLVTRPTVELGVGDERLYAVFGFPAVMGMFMFGGTLLVGGSSYFTKDRDREWWARSGGWLLIITIAWLVFSSVVLFAPAVLHFLHLKLASLAAGTGLAGWGVSKLGSDSDTASGRREDKGEADPRKLPSVSLIKQIAAVLILPVFIVALVMLLATGNTALLERIDNLPPVVASHWPAWVNSIGDATAHIWWLALVYLGVCACASYFINVNTFSLHAMYRERLIRGYLGASNKNRKPHPFTGFDESDDLSMSALSLNKPMHVVNMALNLVGGDNLAWQQRKAESFTSTRLHTGSCRVGYRATDVYGGRYRKEMPPISLGTAITISGAAASPNMGYHSSPLLTVVMTLFNARLGWWLGNPRDKSGAWKQPGPRWGIRSFIDEAFGFTDDQNAWVYLSDGGHFENLAIYEMVMRRCAVIVVSDGGADPTFTYEDLGNAVRKIRVDLGIPIEFDHNMPMWPGRKPVEGLTGRHCAIGIIRYEAVDGEGVDPGVLVYLKPSLNGNEPADVLHYASTDSTFPHQPTPDQFFDEAQFESYRRLGLHVVEEICSAADSGAGAQEKGLPVKFTLDRFVDAACRYASDNPAAYRSKQRAAAAAAKGGSSVFDMTLD